MSTVKIDANDLINSLLGQIAQLAQEKAMLQAQLEILAKASIGEEENDGSNPV